MTVDNPAAALAPAEIVPAVVPAQERAKVLTYMSGLILLMGLGVPYNGLIGLPITYFLKNRLHMDSHALAGFQVIAAIPLYVSFLFGFVRDRWSPFGRRDRGYMMLFGPVTAGLFVIMAFTPVTYVTLLAGMLLLTCAYLLVHSAQSGLASALGQQYAMSGQMSTVLNLIILIPAGLGFFLGGLLSNQLEGQNATVAARALFLTGAAIMLAITAFGFLKPRSVFAKLQDNAGPKINMLADLRRLVTWWPIYPPMLIWFVWSFSPGSGTVLQYYLSDTLHASDSQFGNWNALFALAFLPMFILYGFLCQKVSLRPLLWWGTIIGIPQMIPLIFVHTVTSAMWLAMPIGLMGGICSAAYIDLLIRSCPPGLGGTVMTLSTTGYYIAVRFGDLLGTAVYQNYLTYLRPLTNIIGDGWLGGPLKNGHGGFVVCAILTTLVYALIIPLLLMTPKRLMATRDGQVEHEAALPATKGLEGG